MTDHSTFWNAESADFMSRPSIQIGVIGTGGMGARHIHNLSAHVADATVLAIMDVDGDRMSQVSSAYDIESTYSDPLAVISDSDVDAVVIASPDKTHVEYTLACIDANKPVLCEKPLAFNADEAKQILKAEMANGRRLVQAGFMREFDPAHQKVKAEVQDGAIGQPLLFRGYHNNLTLGFHRDVESVITSSSIHDIHSARWLMGQDIVRVFVQTVPFSNHEPDTCRILIEQLTFQNGGLGVIQFNSDSAYGYEVGVEITGETGVVTTSPLTSPLVRRAGRLTQAIESDWLDRFETAYIREIQSWVAGVASGNSEDPTAWDGYTSLVVADACNRSVETGHPEMVPVMERPAFYPMR
jgi:myo-inositol 2-dehydrogenase/D-chiro-inositol 1-dehydrogenase